MLDFVVKIGLLGFPLHLGVPLFTVALAVSGNFRFFLLGFHVPLRGLQALLVCCLSCLLGLLCTRSFLTLIAFGVCLACFICG